MYKKHWICFQSVKQGTVNPTSYNVIYDESGLPPERLQLLTYKVIIGIKFSTQNNATI